MGPMSQGTKEKQFDVAKGFQVCLLLMSHPLLCNI